MSNKKDRFFSSPSVWLSIGASLFLLIVNLFLSAAPAYAQSDLIPPTAVKCFDDFGYLWQQTVDINNLDANGDVVADLWFDTGATTSFSVPGPFPAAFDGPVYVKIHEVGVYDAGTNRANEGEQADERVKIVLLKDGNVVWESDWSGDSATDDSLETGVNSAEFDYGDLGSTQLIDGFDEVLMVHPADPTYGYGVTAPNDYIPMGVCLEFDALGHIDGRVWCESTTNPDQSYNALEGDTLTPNVTVSVLPDANCDGTADGPAITSVETDASGEYNFDSLPIGPAGSPICYVTQVDTDDADLNSCDSEITNPSIPVQLSMTNPTEILKDFGFDETSASLGDLVWVDTNSNGQFDGEAGVAGVRVILWADPDGDGSTNYYISDTFTDANGNYSFFGLTPNTNYIVSFVAPAGATITQQNTGDDATDSDGFPFNGYTGSYFLSEGEHNPTIDLGLIFPSATATLGDTVFLDANNNGVQDSGEGGIAGVGLIITNTSDNSTTTATTGTNGAYSVTLDPGTYTVAVNPSTLPAGLTNTYDLDGNNNGSTTVTVSAGDDITNVDFGYYNPTSGGTASLGDTVFFDNNNNGVEDSGDTGIAGVDIIITDTSDSSTTKVTTGSNGTYFATLPAGSYTVAVDPSTLPAGLTSTYDLDGNNNGSTPVTLNIGDNLTNIDFGYFAPTSGTATLGDVIFFDANNNGVQDSGEPGIAGVGLIITNTSDNSTTTTTTGVNGAYNVTLDPGTYNVAVVPGTLPAGLTNTYDLDGNNNGSTTVTVSAGDNISNVNFGYFNPINGGTASLGDTVFFDTNNNGVEDSGDTGIAGVDIIITDTSDNSSTTVTTGSNGTYFAALPAGSYTVAVDPSTLPAGLTSTYDLDGNNNGSTPVTLNIGDNLTNIDFGYFTSTGGGTASLGDVIFFDANNNGTQDTNEPGISNVDVIITNTSDSSSTTVTTGANGVYFASLPPGSYTVAVDPDTLPAGATNTYDLDGNNNGSTPVTLNNGDNLTNIDFGYKGVLAVGNYVWEDANSNGTQNEPISAGIGGVLMNLYRDDDGNGVISAGDTFVASTTTAGDGSYLFDCLLPGDYIVQIDESNFTLGTGVLATYNDPAFYGGDPDNNVNTDNNGIVSPGFGVVSEPITLNVGQETLNGGNTNDTVDFAFSPPDSVTAVTMSNTQADSSNANSLLFAVAVLGLSLISWTMLVHKRNRATLVEIER